MHSYRSSNWNSSSSTGSISIGKPAGVVAGDMLIAIEVADPSSTLASMTMTGGTSWTSLASGVTNAVWKVFWKIAGSSEPSTYVFTYTAASGRSATMIVFAIKDPMGFTPIISTDSGGFNTGFNAPSFNPYTPNDMDVRFMVSSAGGWGSINVTRRPSSDGFLSAMSVQGAQFANVYYKNLTSMAPSGLATWNTDTAVSAVVGSIQIPAGPFVPGWRGWGSPR